MTRRFTSGRVGRFGFDDANRLMDAADRVEGMYVGSPADPFGKRRVIVAKLEEDLGTDLFEESEGRTYKVFEWQELGISTAGGTGSGTQTRSIQSTGMSSYMFGDPPNGRAVILEGDGTTGDIVQLVPMIGDGKEVWFGIVRQKASLGASSILRIEGVKETGTPGVYAYSVTPLIALASGGLVPNPDLPVGTAINLYEVGNGHGQPMEFADPPSRISILGPVGGLVVGTIGGASADGILWAFDVVPPMGPECLNGAAFAAGATESVLTRGIA